jgi:glycosyltransferase involved in cell wall biosynthesis
LKPTKILFVGKSLATLSGLSYVSAALIKRFSNDKYIIGVINIDGQPMDSKNIEIQGEEFKTLGKKLTLYNSPLLQPELGKPFDDCVQEFKPDIVVSIHDPWIIDQLVYSLYKDSFFWVHYATIETPIYPPTVLFPSPIHAEARKNIAFSLSTAHCVIPVTEMAKKALERFKLQNLTDVVYLGIDLFKRQTEKKPKSLVFNAGVKDDDFVFMSLGVNSERKMHFRTLEAFALFLQKVDPEERRKIKLYLHTDVSKFYNSTDLVQLTQDLGINHNMIFSAPNIIYSSKNLMERFNACDCYISLTGGEGFGYGFVEALLHEKPLIYSSYGGHAEVCKGHGLEIPVDDYIYATNASFKLGMANKELAAEAMYRIYKEEFLRKQLSYNALETVRKNFDWDQQYLKFKEIVLKSFETWQQDKYYKLHSTFKPKRII